MDLLPFRSITENYGFALQGTSYEGVEIAWQMCHDKDDLRGDFGANGSSSSYYKDFGQLRYREIPVERRSLGANYCSPCVSPTTCGYQQRTQNKEINDDILTDVHLASISKISNMSVENRSASQTHPKQTNTGCFPTSSLARPPQRPQTPSTPFGQARHTKCPLKPRYCDFDTWPARNHRHWRAFPPCIFHDTSRRCVLDVCAYPRLAKVTAVLGSKGGLQRALVWNKKGNVS